MTTLDTAQQVQLLRTEARSHRADALRLYRRAGDHRCDSATDTDAAREAANAHHMAGHAKDRAFACDLEADRLEDSHA
jgi:hypothetical protein